MTSDETPQEEQSEDLLEIQYALAGGELEIEVERPGASLNLVLKVSGETWGQDADYLLAAAPGVVQTVIAKINEEAGE